MSARQWIDVVLALGICDGSGHVESCGYSENDGACFCITLPARLSEAIEPILAAERERIAQAIEAMDGMSPTRELGGWRSLVSRDDAAAIARNSTRSPVLGPDVREVEDGPAAETAEPERSNRPGPTRRSLAMHRHQWPTRLQARNEFELEKYDPEQPPTELRVTTWSNVFSEGGSVSVDIYFDGKRQSANLGQIQIDSARSVKSEAQHLQDLVDEWNRDAAGNWRVLISAAHEDLRTYHQRMVDDHTARLNALKVEAKS